ncbi:hypothetical protein EHEL_100365 [Encephalitozoon hellem ATCC 50504]|uniref:Uncharacterized protein n=1 Tax=Encephalitozoon hellem TaxID=27973 RepID=A0A9Q9C4Q4_ENCHE|nr:uncharacterized protein EHEL_100365 [Encephalitozoon hellem ATCC 50504]AHL28971.1 hypothetical protein EHEL_100365 [Encephalitozoon hellem ATCC 50504]UTX44116.1 hypothetical protein GPU96_10g19050 [Encephalitozoon hellem]WEL39605.1 hypothetical protein PFJ87_10g00520 [Encephalitozoon hellem]
MPRKVSKELQECMREIENVIENSKTPRERINSKKRKMVKLGGHVKKRSVPLNHIMKRIEKRKADAIAERERLESMGVFKKKKNRDR